MLCSGSTATPAEDAILPPITREYFRRELAIVGIVI